MCFQTSHNKKHGTVFEDSMDQILMEQTLFAQYFVEPWTFQSDVYDYL